MAANYIEFDKQSDVGRMVTRGLQLLREGREVLGNARAILIEMRDGDGSQAAHYDVIVGEAGYTANDYADANTAAKASFDEIDSLYSKITAPGGQGDSTGAAITQACARHGV